MDNEYILRWLAEWGKEWVGISLLINKRYPLRAMSARGHVVYIQDNDYAGGTKYRLTDKAINKLTEKENENA